MKANLATIGPKADRLMMEFVAFPFANPKAREYASQGFARRVQTLRRCVENVFKLVPPGTTKIPVKARLRDAGINLQAFVANTYGCLDNLAWIWVHERGLDKIGRKQVGLRKHHASVRASLPVDLRGYLEAMDGKWLDYVTEYRDALAHRIPLYIPPGGVRRKDIEIYNGLTERMNEALNNRKPTEYEKLSDEQDKLLIFQPLMTHSVSETKAHYSFHVQIIADFLTIEELGQKMLAELRQTTIVRASDCGRGKLGS